MRPGYLYPWRTHNQFELLIDGQQFFPVILNAIRQARQSIFLEQYLLISGRIVSEFIHALTEAAHRGVAVYLLLDDYGARMLNATDRQLLQQAPLHCYFYNPFRWTNLYHSLRRDHRKLIIIDHETAYIGGAGLTDSFMFAENTMPPWHDVVVQMRGEVVRDAAEVFYRAWRQGTGSAPAVAIPPSTASGQQGGQLQIAERLSRNEVMRAAIRQIKKSQSRIWIATPYFVASLKLRRELRHAAARGVDVRLLLPGKYSDHPWISKAARYLYQRSLRHGIRIFEYQPCFLHAKMILADNWVSVGSCNLDRWNHRWNLDANVAIEDAKFGAEALACFNVDFNDSIEVTLEFWQQRPRLQRFDEWRHSLSIRLIAMWEYWITHRHQRRK